MMNVNLNSFFPPKVLLPLILLTPYVFVFHYGISVLELFVWAFLILVLLPTIITRDFRLPRFLLVFMLLYTLGYLGALINGVTWSVPIGIWNLNFFYKMLLGIGAFCIGMRYTKDISDLFKSNLLLATIAALGAMAIVYPFLPFDVKVKYFGVFYPQDSGFERYLTSRRPPGFGLNANIYAFILSTYLLFSFRAFLQNKVSVFVPFVAFLIILVLSSKLVIALSVAMCAALILNGSFRLRVSSVNHNIHVFIGKRAFLVGLTLLVALIAIVIVATQTAAGNRVVDSYGTVQRFEAVLAEQAGEEAEPQGFALRVKYWTKGLERAALAPILGIAKDPFLRLQGTLVGFYNPHNEFLRMWLLYGLAGLCAWLYVLAYLTRQNIRYKTDVEWVIFYSALAFFMIFDGGLDDPRVTVYIYLMLGLNWGQLRRAKYAVEIQQQPAKPHTELVTAT